MARVKPRLIALEVDGVDRSNEVDIAKIVSGAAQADFTSFEEARSGGAREYALNMRIAQDHASGTLWDLIWTGAGDDVEGVYAPYGNEDPSVGQPHYTFTAVVSEPDGDFLGGESNTSTTAVAVIEVSWKLTGKPVKITA